ncbi:hypothetical protein QCA50_019046 [Cerrena zonata]|uniref:Hyaluronan/mRNA-binding protein domain-containing protein n=1 Tax=Cerrena zonata TaxID=2478898 RepID=A0AAW0FMT8_9APHY
MEAKKKFCNDVEDDSTPQLPIREVVKNTSSSKKKDVAPAKADPSRSKNKPKPTGNEGALKSRNNNKNVEAPSSTPSKHYKRPFDRHSRSGKADSGKKVRQGWGGNDKSELQDETEGLQDAVEDLEAESGESTTEAVAPKKSLNDYFAELKIKQQELDGSKNLRKANEGAEEKWSQGEVVAKQQESFVESSVAKKAKQKSQKEKKFLDFEATFADEQKPFRSESARGNFKRGGRRGGANAQGGRKPSSKATTADKKPLDDKNFPSL